LAKYIITKTVLLNCYFIMGITLYKRLLCVNTGYLPLVSWLLPSANAHVKIHAMLCSRRKSPLLRATEIPPPVALSAQRAHGPHRGDATDAVGQGKDGTGVACTKQQLLTINSPVILRGILKTVAPRTWLNCHFRLGKNL